MNTVSAFEAKTYMGKLLDRVAKGEEIIITRHEKPVARIVPEGRVSDESLRETVRGLRALRARIASRKGGRRLTDREIKSAVNEGRR
ncbi:MAG: type II toxin-antitoxin system prevent-host-death family antitoxin [Acidimicrobiia bacterium]|nr:type II toxin-antitoxin system prevent-host-death family antitoxin [Acidimicrobiia bacterium]